MDYAALSAVILDFDACDTRQCVFLTVEDDLVLEMDESLEITLNRTAGLDSRITLDPTEGEVVIVDNDGMPPSLICDLLYAILCKLFQMPLLVWRGHSTVSWKMWVWLKCALLYSFQTSPAPLGSHSL